jgi:hypothetical protein
MIAWQLVECLQESTDRTVKIDMTKALLKCHLQVLELPQVLCCSSLLVLGCTKEGDAHCVLGAHDHLCTKKI